MLNSPSWELSIASSRTQPLFGALLEPIEPIEPIQAHDLEPNYSSEHPIDPPFGALHELGPHYVNPFTGSLESGFEPASASHFSSTESLSECAPPISGSSWLSSTSYRHSSHAPSNWSLGSGSEPAPVSHFSSTESLSESLFAPQRAPPISGRSPTSGRPLSLLFSRSSTIPQGQGAGPCEHISRGVYILSISLNFFAAKAPVSPLPTVPNGRFSGQRLQADQTLINRSFANDSIRRTPLNRVLQSAWYQQHKMEPLYQSSRDDVTQGLDLPLKPRKDSVFKAFLRSDGKCQFGAVEREECPKVESKLRRALGHVRSHLGHRPFVCGGCEKCANRSE